ncbi:formyltetrahydrofolate deformylase [Acidiferrimicrobium sp. IK]|uniref:formyltetrahydrofolate deformylase n=1 Tax=Acidiferrimicrobium sp. IK TaxID=2871700 RepID=UPI0039674B4C|nr:formyltetrahydrofolate deformylase [Acidiferrimicrobium sp. IK]
MTTVRMLLWGPDRPGLVASAAAFVAERDGNIVHADQHTDAEAATFFQRIEWRPAADAELTAAGRVELAGEVAALAARLGMDHRLRYADEDRPFALLVSRQPHCLLDLLARWYSGELPGRPAVVVSNHPDHAEVTGRFGVPFHHLPAGPGQEEEIVEILAGAGVEAVILARYMRVLSPTVLDRWPAAVINIHHSFLPAFVGGRPYHQAHHRGVKLIGATAHYATADLDEGPIIEQDVVRVTHRDDVEALVHAGRDLETVVLARAVRWHLTDRVLVYGNKTVVFN